MSFSDKVYLYPNIENKEENMLTVKLNLNTTWVGRKLK